MAVGICILGSPVISILTILCLYSRCARHTIVYDDCYPMCSRHYGFESLLSFLYSSLTSWISTLSDLRKWGFCCLKFFVGFFCCWFFLAFWVDGFLGLLHLFASLVSLLDLVTAIWIATSVQWLPKILISICTSCLCVFMLVMSGGNQAKILMFQNHFRI